MLRTFSKGLADSFAWFDLCQIADMAVPAVNAATGHVENAVGTTGTYIGTLLALPRYIRRKSNGRRQ
jgi:hypothetical protein